MIIVPVILTYSRKKSPTSKREDAIAPMKVGDEIRLSVPKIAFSIEHMLLFYNVFFANWIYVVAWSTMRKPSECLPCVKYMRKISKVQKNLRMIGYLGLERPEVTLRETKGCFRRGTEKLTLQALAK
ncbi:hypothetical protein BDD39_002326 [Saccharococcus thermophilus]|uniref:Uncharacterized protein n=1 Tax=Saccharococcus thermophilus TaxID=29396 RepID=A0A846MJK7_9BACL|nr:hypothetical protein [Saccharococcus thermophilus]